MFKAVLKNYRIKDESGEIRTVLINFTEQVEESDLAGLAKNLAPLIERGFDFFIFKIERLKAFNVAMIKLLLAFGNSVSEVIGLIASKDEAEIVAAFQLEDRFIVDDNEKSLVIKMLRSHNR